MDFGWYNWVWYKENAGLDVPRLGRFLRIADSYRNIMTYHVFPALGIPVAAGTVQRVMYIKQQTDSVWQHMSKFILGLCLLHH